MMAGRASMSIDIREGFWRGRTSSYKKSVLELVASTIACTMVGTSSGSVYSDLQQNSTKTWFNPLAAPGKVPQGLEAYIEGGQNCNISDSRNAFEIYCDLP